LVDLQHRYSTPDIQTLLDIAAFLDPRFKDLDPIVAVTDRVDVEESVKLEILGLVEDGSEDNDGVVEEVTSASEKNQSDEQVPCLDRTPSKRKEKHCI